MTNSEKLVQAGAVTITLDGFHATGTVPQDSATPLGDDSA